MVTRLPCRRALRHEIDARRAELLRPGGDPGIGQSTPLDWRTQSSSSQRRIHAPMCKVSTGIFGPARAVLAHGAHKKQTRMRIRRPLAHADPLGGMVARRPQPLASSTATAGLPMLVGFGERHPATNGTPSR